MAWAEGCHRRQSNTYARTLDKYQFYQMSDDENEFNDKLSQGYALDSRNMSDLNHDKHGTDDLQQEVIDPNSQRRDPNRLRHDRNLLITTSTPRDVKQVPQQNQTRIPGTANFRQLIDLLSLPKKYGQFQWWSYDVSQFSELVRHKCGQHECQRLIEA